MGRSPVRNRVSGIMRWLGWFFFLVGVTTSMGVMYGIAWRVAPRAEAPLTTISSFAVDADGRIYCGTSNYQRVQVYEPDGTYVRGWFVGAGGGDFSVAISAAGTVEVATARGRFLEEYSPDAVLLSRRRLGILEEEEFPHPKRIPVPGRPACSLILVSSVFHPGVKRECQSGEEEWIVRNPLRLWPLSAPFPALAYVLVGLVLLRISGERLIQWEPKLPGLE